MQVSNPILPDDPRKRRTDDRLGSWKAISAYLERDVSTVQRWEKHEGMPVHRHLHAKRGSVYAYRAELDAWWASRASRLDTQQAATPTQEAILRPPTHGLRHRWSSVVALSAFVLLGAGAFALWLVESAGRAESNPLAEAEFSTLTDFDGIEHAAAISRDGRLAAFVSDRDGTWDVWITQIGTREFRNLTLGRAGSLLNHEVRTLAFSPDGALVTVWVKTQVSESAAEISVWAVPAIGGPLRPYLPGAAELDWSSDGTRIVYHPAAPGDPMFVAGSPREAGRQIYVAPHGIHNHFPVWSPDDEYIYFVHGVPPDKTDVWRIGADGSDPQRLTFHDSRVSHPVLLDRRALLYLATTPDGSGPWLHVLDLVRGNSRRLALGVERYTSLAASADGRRIVATLARAKSSLWRATITQDVIDTTTARRIAMPTTGGRSPRFGPGFLLYVATESQQDTLWKLADGGSIELWSAPQTRIVGGPALSPDGRHVAFTTERGDRSALTVMTSEGTDVRALAESLNVRGPPAWSPDGASITVAVLRDGMPRLVSVPLDGRAPMPIIDDYSTDPSWSPDGRFLFYSDEEVGPSLAVKAATARGQPVNLPNIRLSRGARRIALLSGGSALVVLRGEMGQGDLWRIDLKSGEQRRLTNVGRVFAVRDFDVSADGSEVVFDRRTDDSDVVLIDRASESVAR